MKKYIFAAFIIASIVTAFAYRNNFKYTNVIHTDTLMQPVVKKRAPSVLKAEAGKFVINVHYNGASTLSGLIMVSNKNRFSCAKAAELLPPYFPRTMIVAFGKNLEHGCYKDARRIGSDIAFNSEHVYRDDAQHIAVITPNNMVRIKINNLKPGDQVAFSGLNVTKAVFFEKGADGQLTQITGIENNGDGRIVYIDSPDDIKIIKRGSRKFYYASILSALGAVGVIAAAIIL